MFSPWRMAYIREGGGGNGGCIFCVGERDLDDPETLLLGVYPKSLALCNKFPYNNGHVLLAPRRHAADLTLLAADERGELMSLLALATDVLREAYRPEGINIGMNIGKVAGAGIVDHVHIHLVPRWAGDTNFMTSVHSTRVLPESLQETRARLAPLFGPLRP